MELISIILHSSVFSLMFLLVYYVNVRLNSISIFKNNKFLTSFRTQMDSLFYASFTVLYLFIARNNELAVMTLFIFAGMISLSVIGLWESMFIFFTGFIYSVWYIEINVYAYVSITVYLTYLLVYNLTNTYLKKEIANNLTNFVQIAIWTIAFIIFVILRTHSLYQVFYRTLFIAIFYAILSYLNYFIIRVSLSANSLSYSVEYSYSKYYRFRHRDESILNLIRENNISKGIFVTFRTIVINNENEQQWDEVRETVLEKLEEKLETKVAVWFRSRNHYGFFVGYDNAVDLEKSLDGNKRKSRTSNDALKAIENLFESIPRRYETLDGNEVSIRINVAASIYGVQSSSINELDEMNDYSLLVMNSFGGNVVKLTNANSIRRRINSTKDLNLLNSRYRIDNYIIRYDRVFNSNKNSTILNIATQTKVDSEVDYGEVRYIKKKRWVSKIFDRYFAFYAINNFSERREIDHLAFYYSPQILEDEFDIDEFVATIVNSGLSRKQVKLIFLQSQLNTIKNEEMFHKNLEVLAKEGIGLILHFNDSQNYHRFSDIKFEKAIIYEQPLLNEFKNKYNIDVIFANIQNDEKLESISAKGVKLFTGNALLGV